MEKSKTTRYFKYAIGEIALVMIGILLALQVNNWNEKRKLSNSIDNLMTAFENELVNNINESDGLIGRGYLKDSMITRYVNNTIAAEDILDNSSIFLSFGTRTRQFIDENLNKLIEMEKDLPKKYKLLMPEFRELKRQIESQREWEKKTIELSIERRKENVDKLPWLYLRDSLSLEKAKTYILTNPIHKNKILQYHEMDLNENTWDASLIKTSSLALIWNIKKLRGTQETSIETFLKSFDMIPFQELRCDAYPLESKERVNFRLNHILYNKTDETVSYNYVNLEGKVLNSNPIILSPYSFRLSEFSLPTNIAIEVLENGQCNKVYRRYKEDYLVIN